MSDYLFMLESHLTPAQRDVVAAVSVRAAETGEQVFLVGGAMRDMLGGFPITDLDFTVQGNAPAFVKKLAQNTGAVVLETDKLQKSSELLFPGGVTAEVSMAQSHEFGKPGRPPKVKPATIHDDLLRRDFTVNSMALSLHPAARGLLLDPTNGLADLERQELRAFGNYGFYDDPVRLLRLIRFRVRFGFTVAERTQNQYANARESGVEAGIPPRELYRELRNLANESNYTETLSALGREKLLSLFSPGLAGTKLNLGAFGKLEKAKQMIPHGVNLHLDNLGLFLHFLTEKMTPQERAGLAKNLKMTKDEVDLWKGLESRSRKLESALKSQKLHRSSEVYFRLRESQGDEILFLYLNSKERLVHDRIRSFFQKHIYVAQEVTDREVAMTTGLEPDHPAFGSVKHDMIVARLDGRKYKLPAELRPPEPEAPTQEPARRKALKKALKKAAAKQKAAKAAKKPAKPKPAPKKAAKSTSKTTAKKTPRKTAAKKAVRKKAAKSTSKTTAKKTVRKTAAKKSAVSRSAKKPGAKRAARGG